MEEYNNETYAYETQPNSEELLKIKKAELKELKIKAGKDRAFRLANSKKRRDIRDDKLDRINLKLRTIKEKIGIYNKLGKVGKGKMNILKAISNLIANDIELMEEITRTQHINPEDMVEEAENEVYDPEVEQLD